MTESTEARRVRALLGVAGALHASLLLYFTPVRVVLAKAPFVTFDYALHVYQTDRALRAFRATGHLWSWDPFALAGHPAGALEDMTTRSLELFVIVSTKLGMATWVAFDVFVILVHLALPLSAWAAARWFGLSRTASATTVLLWVLLWYFDSLLHWFFYVGMISWAAASYLVPLVAAAMYRAVSSHRPRAYVALAALSALLTLVHPFSPVVLLPVLVALYARAFKGLARWEHGALVLSAVAAGGTILTWIGPALRFRHLVGRVDLFLMPDPSYALTDFLELLRDVLQTGEPVRTAFRTVVFVLAGVAVVRLRREKDERALPLALLAFGGVLVAYLGKYSDALSQTQPYRNLGPAILGAALAGADGVVDSFRPEKPRDARANGAIALGAALALPALLGVVVRWLPTALPGGPTFREPARELALPGRELSPVVTGHDGPPPVYADVAHYLEAEVGQSARVAVTDWVLGEYLAAFTTVPILGGIPQRYVPQALSHPLRVNLVPEGSGDDPLARYLRDYAIGVVITNGPTGPFDGRPDLLEPAEGLGPYRLYRTRIQPSYFAAGSGTVETQSLNTVHVTTDGAGSVVLRFHYLETLRCRPNCVVEEEKRPRDTASFIRVRNSPAVFDIVNAYE